MNNEEKTKNMNTKIENKIRKKLIGNIYYNNNIKL